MANQAQSDTTQWTLIRRAQGQGPAARVALTALVRRYEGSIIALIRAYRHPPNLTPEEIKQEFLLGVVAHHDLLKLDPLKGRFRSWLAVAVRCHLVNAWKKFYAEKNPERWTDHPEMLEIAGAETAEHVLLRKFAVETLRQAEERLRANPAKRARFEALRQFLPVPDMGLDDARAVAERLGMPLGTLHKAVHDLRRDFAKCLRQTVADTLDLDPNDPDFDPSDPAGQLAIERELRELHGSLCASLELTVV